MAKTILEALNELVAKQGGNTEDNKLIVDALNDLVESGGGSSGGASFPTITITVEYDEEDQSTLLVTDYGEFTNFDGLMMSTPRYALARFVESGSMDVELLCSVRSSGSEVYLTTLPFAVYGGGTWHVTSDSYTIGSDNTVSEKSIAYNFS